MARQLITRDELRAELQRRIETSRELDGDCRECGAPGIYILLEPEKNNGCNWSPSYYRGLPECRGVIERVVREAQALYNVQD